MHQIEASHLTKRYVVTERQAGCIGLIRGLIRPQRRTIEALTDVNFTLDRGESLGLIGPNGSGKSTTIKILSGVLKPDGGRVVVEGKIPHLHRIAHVSRIGVVFGNKGQLAWELSVIDNYDLLREIYRVERTGYRNNLDELVAMLELGGLLDRPVRQLSLGQRMRAEVAAALLHQPSILFLDEPTIGLDAPAKQAVRGFVRKLSRERGTTLLLTSHDMNDVDAMVDRVLILGGGRLLLDCTCTALRSKLVTDRRLAIRFAHVEPNLDIRGVTVRSREDGYVKLSYDPRAISTSELVALIVRDHEVRDLLFEDVNLDEVLLNTYDALGLRGDRR